MTLCRCTTGCKQPIEVPEVTDDLCGQCYANGCDSLPKVVEPFDDPHTHPQGEGATP